jgi:hypothetical protein
LRALAISARVRLLTLAAALAMAFVMAVAWLQAHALFTRNAGAVHRFMSGLTDEYRTAAILTWSVSVSIKALFFFLAGWLAVRIHRSSPRMVLALLVALYFLFPMRLRAVIPPVGQTAVLITIYASGLGCLLLGGLVSMYMTRLDRRT